ncbi:hypothetical protein JCM3766R1_004897 [Sporobolomyces carnicolor]
MTVRLSLVVLLLTALASTLSTVRGQQSTPSSAIANPSSLSRISSSVTLSLSPNATRAFGGLASVASALATASNSAPVSTSATAAPANSSSPVKPSQRPTLDTRIDATFGILGGLLIVSGLALGSVGTLHRRSASFLSGTYAGALVVGLLIVHFALVGRETGPKSVIRGVFLLASIVAGLVSGAFCFLFHRAGELLESSLAGFVLGATVLCTRSDSLIRPVGLRYILLLALSAVFFVLSSIPRLAVPLVLVSTSLLGAIAVVVGIDCFTTAGLKEFYVYSFGFTTLFPKLEGRYVLESAVVIELGVILALFICMMAFQHRFYVLLGRKQQHERENQHEEAARTTRIDERARRTHEAHVGDWEDRYGKGRRVVSESAVALAAANGNKRKNWFGFGKSRKMSKANTSASTASSVSNDKSRSKSTLAEPTSAASVDFLPRLEVEFGDERQLERPALATVQSAPSGSIRIVHDSNNKEGWDDYLSTRQVAMSSFKTESLAARSRSSLALVSPPASVPKSSPRFRDEADEADVDDDTPLALSPRRPNSSAVRSHSSPQLETSSRRVTTSMYELPSTVSLPEPAAAIPRSHSRALSLVQQIPAVLLESPSRPTLTRSGSQPGMLDRETGRRATLVDLNEPSRFNPYNERERVRTASDDRVVVGDRRRISMNSLTSPSKQHKVREGPKIMDFEDLDAKHRKRLSLLQTSAAETVAAEKAKAEFVQRQQAEAATQRRKEHERQRSASWTNLVGGISTVDEFGQQIGSGRGGSLATTRPRSVASLSGLLSLHNNSKRNRTSLGSEADGVGAPAVLVRSGEEAQVDGEVAPASPARTRPYSAAGNERRQSCTPGPSPTGSRASLQQQHQLGSPLPPAPSRNVRRHSLTTLLETSFDDASSSTRPFAVDVEDRPVVASATRERAQSSNAVGRGGVEKVTEWRRSGTFAPSPSSSSRPRPPPPAASIANTTAVLPPSTSRPRLTPTMSAPALALPTANAATTVATPTSSTGRGRSKKNSWLDY